MSPTSHQGRSPRSSILLLLCCVSLSASCSGAQSPMAVPEGKADKSGENEATDELKSSPSPAPMVESAKAKKEEGKVGKREAPGNKPMSYGAAMRKASTEADRDTPAQDQSVVETAEAALRSWFPETFLWEPVVATDARGQALVDLTVPDSLTSWRVLALAHSREGEQTGGLARFSSTMPVYADVVLPSQARVGDRLQLPVQVVNNTARPGQEQLGVNVQGAASGSAGGSLSMAPWASAVRFVEVKANTPGQATVSLKLGTTDRVERELRIVPTGRRVSSTHGGSLGVARELEVSPSESGRPSASSMSLTVFPGPLSFVVAELAEAGLRIQRPGDLSLLDPRGSRWIPETDPTLRRLSDAAYAYALSGQGRELASKWGAKSETSGFPKQEALRALRLRAWQGILRDTRTAQGVTPLIGLAAMRTWPDDPLARGLADRLASQVASSQSSDGSFASVLSGAQVSIERALVFTAEAARLAGERQPTVQKRAQGFIARNGAIIDDPYTAAIVLASGCAPEQLQERLRKLLVEGIQTQAGGSRWLVPGPKAIRADGSAPSTIEATAQALLALSQDPESKALVQELGSSLMSTWTPTVGFGDGQTGLVVLGALARLMAEPPPESVEVILSGNGRELLRRRLELAGGFEPALLELPASTEPLPTSWRVEASPAVPGLSFAITRTDWIPSPLESRESDRIRVSHKGKAKVGEPLAIAIVAPASSSRSHEVELDLPTGFELDMDRMRMLQEQGRVASWSARDGHLSLKTPKATDSLSWTVEISAIPSFAGHFEGGEASLDLGRKERFHAAVPSVEVAL